MSKASDDMLAAQKADRDAFNALSPEEKEKHLALVGLGQLQTVSDNVASLQAWIEVLDRIGSSDELSISTHSIALIAIEMMAAYENLETPLLNLVSWQQAQVAEKVGKSSLKVVK